MISKDIFFSKIPTSELKPDRTELALRLGMPKSKVGDFVADIEAELREVIDCRYSGFLTDISFPCEDSIDIGFAVTESLSLYVNLKDCRKAFVFAVTLGHGVDRFLRKLSVVSPAKHFAADALASAYAEAACDFADAKIKGTYICRPRFSPGYGDLKLAIQPDLLNAVNAGSLLGVTVGETLFMTPSKSVTAIMGVKSEF